MLSIDLAVTRAGVDLEPLYKKWGLESVAVSTSKKQIIIMSSVLNKK
jgi:hypothetical protein